MSRSKKIRIPAFFICFGLLFTLAGAPLAASAYDLPADVTISAKTALLVSLGPTEQDDTVLFEQNADQQNSPAALVRLMVGLTALKIIRDRNIDIDSTTGTYTLDDFNAIAGTDLATANMKIGDVWSVRDLLSVSTISTSADACVTLAVALDGSQSQFVSDMNALAGDIGCTNTSFNNVTGNDNINQYMSAQDAYKIIRYGMDDSEFESLFSTKQYDTHPVTGQARTFVNTCGLLSSYAPMVIGKTGFSDAAGYCLASVARDSGYEYLCVVMNDPAADAGGKKNVHYTDTKTLYKWAFANFTYKTLMDKNQPVTQMKVKLAWNKDTVTLVPETSFATTVINDLDPSQIIAKPVLYSDPVDAPVTKGQVYGKVEFYINLDQKIGEVNLVANESVDRSEVLALWDQVQKFLTSPWFYVLLILLVLLLIGYVVLNIVHNQKRRKNRRQRLKKY